MATLFKITVATFAELLLCSKLHHSPEEIDLDRPTSQRRKPSSKRLSETSKTALLEKVRFELGVF